MSKSALIWKRKSTIDLLGYKFHNNLLFFNTSTLVELLNKTKVNLFYYAGMLPPCDLLDREISGLS